MVQFHIMLPEDLNDRINKLVEHMYPRKKNMKSYVICEILEKAIELHEKTGNLWKK